MLYFFGKIFQIRKKKILFHPHVGEPTEDSTIRAQAKITTEPAAQRYVARPSLTLTRTHLHHYATGN